MSIYATFFVLADDEDHEPDCARYRLPKDGEEPTVWFDDNFPDSVYDDTIACSCRSLGAPYRYVASNASITGPDHERVGYLTCCGAVSTHTVRLSLPEGGATTVLLDYRQVTALRDALTRFLENWDDPEEYGRADALRRGGAVSIRVPYPFPLRTDFVAELVLPEDMSRPEAIRLGAFIMALAVDASPCPRCLGTGLAERMATPDEVDAGCELGVAYDRCPECSS